MYHETKTCVNCGKMIFSRLSKVKGLCVFCDNNTRTAYNKIGQ